MRVDRREFLRKAGLGSVALGSLPALAHALATPAWAQGRTNFMFLAVSATSAAGTPPVQHFVAMGGTGNFDPSGQRASPVEGGGTFFHWTGPGAAPRPLVGSGTWKARLLVSYKQIGTYGVAAAGIAELVIDVTSQMPTTMVVRGARLKIACNLGPAALMNPGEIEGVTLNLPGTDFSAGGTFGPFAPIPPSGTGLTVFTTVPLPS